MDRHQQEHTLEFDTYPKSFLAAALFQHPGILCSMKKYWFNVSKNHQLQLKLNTVTTMIFFDNRERIPSSRSLLNTVSFSTIRIKSASTWISVSPFTSAGICVPSELKQSTISSCFERNFIGPAMSPLDEENTLISQRSAFRRKHTSRRASSTLR